MYLLKRNALLASRSSGLGTTGYNPVLSLPIVPNILAEWTSLIPLVTHLAGYQHDHQVVGVMSLVAHIDVSLFPRLGALMGYAELLNEGADFLDRVSTIGEVSLYVWDVNWGSTFPCANGSASQIVTNYARRGLNPEGIDIPDRIPEVIHGQKSEQPILGVDIVAQPPKNQSLSPRGSTTAKLQKRNEHQTSEKRQSRLQPHNAEPSFRRYQVLHVLDFGRHVSILAPSQNKIYHQIFDMISQIFLIGVIIVLCLCGIFGTAAIVLNGMITRLVSRHIKIRRPPGYLENNEDHKACMLLSNHKNASTWYLYVGDRGVVDSLLNKPMIIIPPHNKLLSSWFKVAHIIQLLAMTFVAAQKGWDGLALLLLLMFEQAFQWYRNEDQIAKKWLADEGVSMKAKSFRFTGRTPMVGAIHKLSGSAATAWMDDIVAPCARRNVWLKQLSKESNEVAEKEAEADQDFEILSPFDQKWVSLNSGLVFEAFKVMKSELGRDI